jgi:5-methylcytosine-specific restriction endonuclease McrA
MRANYQRNRPQRQMHAKQRRHGPEREQVLAVQRDGYRRNADTNRERARVYAADHSQEARERVQNWRRANPERARANSQRDKLRRRVGRNLDAYEYVALALRYDPCAYCGAPAETIDHIDPLSGAVNNDWENLTAACGACNSSKQATGLLRFLQRRITGGRDPMRQCAGRE